MLFVECSDEFMRFHSNNGEGHSRSQRQKSGNSRTATPKSDRVRDDCGAIQEENEERGTSRSRIGLGVKMAAQRESKEGRAGLWEKAAAVGGRPDGGKGGIQGYKRDRASSDPLCGSPRGNDELAH